MVDDVLLNEVALIASVVSSTLLLVSEMMGTFGTKYKSITSLLLSVLNIKGCLQPVIDKIDKVARDSRLIEQVKDEIRIEELREVLVRNRTNSQPILESQRGTGTIERPVFVTLPNTTHTDYIRDHRPSITLSTISSKDSIHTNYTMITFPNSQPNSYSSLRLQTNRSHSVPMIDTQFTQPLGQPLGPLQNGASSSVEDSDTLQHRRAYHQPQEPLPMQHQGE